MLVSNKINFIVFYGVEVHYKDSHLWLFNHRRFDFIFKI
jgi:hypothetical protein